MSHIQTILAVNCVVKHSSLSDNILEQKFHTVIVTVDIHIHFEITKTGSSSVIKSISGNRREINYLI